MQASTWTQCAARQFQLFAEQLTTMFDVSDLDVRTDALLRAVPHPTSRLDNFVLTILLCRAMLNIADHFHQPNWPGVCRCRTLTVAAVKKFLTFESRDTREDFRQWFDQFSLAYVAHHPRCGACIAARLVRTEPARRWHTEDLTGQLSISAAQLTKMFRSEFGVTPREYVEVVRLWHALPSVFAGMKIEAIALEVGYGGKKNFYKVFEKWLGVTPKGLRTLSAARAEFLTESLKRRVFKMCTANAPAPSVRIPPIVISPSTPS